MSWVDEDSQFMLPAYTRLSLTIVKGDGCYLFDEDGNKYLDMFAGVGVNQLGYNHPVINKTILEQSKKLIHSPFHFYNPVAIEYAKKLSELSINGKVFFTTSGAEATEAALKMIYKWKKRKNDDRNGIVVFRKSFHGRTLGAISFTRQPNVFQDYPKTIFEPIEIQPNNIEELEEAILTQNPIAFIMEPVLGSGGIIPISDDFMRIAREICDQNNILLIMDEIQSGMGRTGTFFAYQTSGIIPDAVLFGKGAGGGIPLGGVIAGPKLCETYKTGDHGTTWAHPPLATALGLAVVNVLVKEKVMDSKQRSQHLFEGLIKIQDSFPHIINEIRYKGLMFGITISLTPDLSKELQISLMKNGVLVDLTQGNIIRLLPPLIISHSEIEEFLSKFENTLEHFWKKHNISFH